MTLDSNSPVAQALRDVLVPGLGLRLLETGARLHIEESEAGSQLRVLLGYPAGGIAAALTEQIRAALADAGLADVAVHLDWKVVAHAVQGTLAPLPAVRNVIAVASGKGGVGKSTTAVNIALALAHDGARVGIMDADVYGPSQPRMLGLLGRNPETLDGKTFEPLTAHGLESISIGFLIDEDRPIIWRGPMVTQAINQLIFQTNWHDLDYLLIDLPPGTGDTHLTLTQKVPVAGAIIVTTPQDIALQDARKGLRMFEKVSVPVLGVVENMSTHVCPACGHESALFGTGGGERLAEETGVPLLGQLPLDAGVREHVDSGRPSVIAEPEGPIAARYLEIARRAAVRLAQRPRDQRGRFGTVVVEGR